MARKAAAGWEYLSHNPDTGVKYKDPRSKVQNLATGEILSRRQYLKELGTPILSYRRRVKLLKSQGLPTKPNRQQYYVDRVREFRTAHGPKVHVRGDYDDANLFREYLAQSRDYSRRFELDRAETKRLFREGLISADERRKRHDREWARLRKAQLKADRQAGLITDDIAGDESVGAEHYL